MESIQQFRSGLYWYCIRAKPKKERAAAEHLASHHSLEVYCPQIRFRRKTLRGPVWFQEALFPGYLFACFDMFEMKRAVSFAPGILNIPLFSGRVIPIPDEVIDALRTDMDSEGVVNASEPLQIGDETTILEGSMRGLKVRVIRLMPAQQRVGVLMELLGTLVESEFPSDALEHRIKHPVSICT